jgi:hypothetical protein
MCSRSEQVALISPIRSDYAMWMIAPETVRSAVVIRSSRMSCVIERDEKIVKQYSSAPVSTVSTFQDLPRLRETADNKERCT